MHMDTVLPQHAAFYVVVLQGEQEMCHFTSRCGPITPDIKHLNCSCQTCEPIGCWLSVWKSEVCEYRSCLACVAVGTPYKHDVKRVRCRDRHEVGAEILLKMQHSGLSLHQLPSWVCKTATTWCCYSYRVIKKSLCTWWLQYRNLTDNLTAWQPTARARGTRDTLTPPVIPNSNYVIMVSDWNCLKYFCVLFVL
jgi:hypothetical protein